MKDLNCHDPKMEAYCKLVRRLADKFDGLELNHIARKFNEAADELAKMASARASVPPNIFARDLHKPSVDYVLATQVKGSRCPRGGVNWANSKFSCNNLILRIAQLTPCA